MTAIHNAGACARCASAEGQERTPPALSVPTAIFSRSLYFLRYGSENIVSRDRPTDTLERKLTNRLNH
jgi:hypothetical protein